LQFFLLFRVANRTQTSVTLAALQNYKKPNINENASKKKKKNYKVKLKIISTSYIVTGCACMALTNALRFKLTNRNLREYL
jgi:hypothetical protein